MNVDRSCIGVNDRQQLDIRPTPLGWSTLLHEENIGSHVGRATDAR